MPPPDPTGPITALTAAITELLPNQPLISLVTPSFDWNTMAQYDFQLFHKSVESWFTLQNVPVETPVDPTAEPNSTQLEYMLNFLGNTCHRKFDHGKPTSTADEIAKNKKLATTFMDYLSSTMEHAVSQCCRIYWLEDFTSDLESHQMNSLTISELLLIDATSRQKRKRNGVSSTDSSETPMTRNSSRSC